MGGEPLLHRSDDRVDPSVSNQVRELPSVNVLQGEREAQRRRVGVRGEVTQRWQGNLRDAGAELGTDLDLERSKRHLGPATHGQSEPGTDDPYPGRKQDPERSIERVRWAGHLDPSLDGPSCAGDYLG